jgi:hypothetical protein
MSQVVKNPIPKARFQESVDNISKHRDLIQMREFQRACDFSMLQYQIELANATNGNVNLAAAAHMKLCGAQEFLFVLRNLGESFALPSGSGGDSGNLDHTA